MEVGNPSPVTSGDDLDPLGPVRQHPIAGCLEAPVDRVQLGDDVNAIRATEDVESLTLPHPGNRETTAGAAGQPRHHHPGRQAEAREPLECDRPQYAPGQEREGDPQREDGLEDGAEHHLGAVRGCHPVILGPGRPTWGGPRERRRGEAIGRRVATVVPEWVGVRIDGPERDPEALDGRSGAVCDDEQAEENRRDRDHDPCDVLPGRHRGPEMSDESSHREFFGRGAIERRDTP